MASIPAPHHISFLSRNTKACSKGITQFRSGFSSRSGVAGNILMPSLDIHQRKSTSELRQGTFQSWFHLSWLQCSICHPDWRRDLDKDSSTMGTLKTRLDAASMDRNNDLIVERVLYCPHASWTIISRLNTIPSDPGSFHSYNKYASVKEMWLMANFDA